VSLFSSIQFNVDSIQKQSRYCNIVVLKKAASVSERVIRVNIHNCSRLILLAK